MNGAGFGAALVNNQMYAFGGLQGGTPSTASVSANLNAGPTLANFNAPGSGTLTIARALHGTAIESAFIYQLGGLGAGPPSCAARNRPSGVPARHRWFVAGLSQSRLMHVHNKPRPPLPPEADRPARPERID